ncbi:hypothetical protein BU26DRAFT_246263 [Trematosphaeria pertusa]|uniref:Uncharacterized protein n=1 Tax=Trematosphaeria pertusa TaxID=390896 RepID=A0A6A6IN30_9PLEO|nr:uncharacterized protein BU26DRAFT_246263 [Trematosphaeria pertusa]KAF2251861.1 hypothetical protein BU26DRAFT_246263 [Trematosphaeria pertusa]
MGFYSRIFDTERDGDAVSSSRNAQLGPLLRRPFVVQGTAHYRIFVNTIVDVRGHYTLNMTIGVYYTAVEIEFDVQFIQLQSICDEYAKALQAITPRGTALYTRPIYAIEYRQARHFAKPARRRLASLAFLLRCAPCCLGAESSCSGVGLGYGNVTPAPLGGDISPRMAPGLFCSLSRMLCSVQQPMRLWQSRSFVHSMCNQVSHGIASLRDFFS